MSSNSITAATPGCWFAWQSIFLEESLPSTAFSGCNIFRFMQLIEMQNSTLLSPFLFYKWQGKKDPPKSAPSVHTSLAVLPRAFVHKIEPKLQLCLWAKHFESLRDDVTIHHPTPILNENSMRLDEKKLQDEKIYEKIEKNCFKKKRTRKEKTNQNTWSHDLVDVAPPRQSPWVGLHCRRTAVRWKWDPAKIRMSKNHEKTHHIKHSDRTAWSPKRVQQ